jgi:hypothetical protein
MAFQFETRRDVEESIYTCFLAVHAEHPDLAYDEKQNVAALESKHYSLAATVADDGKNGVKRYACITLLAKSVRIKAGNPDGYELQIRGQGCELIQLQGWFLALLNNGPTVTPPCGVVVTRSEATTEGYRLLRLQK